MTPLQRASLIAVVFMLSVFLCFMTCVPIFFGIERYKKLVREMHMHTIQGSESSGEEFVLAIV